MFFTANWFRRVLDDAGEHQANKRRGLSVVAGGDKRLYGRTRNREGEKNAEAWGMELLV